MGWDVRAGYNTYITPARKDTCTQPVGTHTETKSATVSVLRNCARNQNSLPVFRILLVFPPFHCVPSLCIFLLRPRPPCYRMRSEQVLKSKQVEAHRLLHPLRDTNVLWHMAELRCPSNGSENKNPEWRLKRLLNLTTFVPRPSRWGKQGAASLSKPYEVCWKQSLGQELM